MNELLETPNIDKPIEALNRKAKRVLTLATICGLVGLAVLIWSIFQFNFKTDSGLPNFGQFVSGPVTALWSLTGLLLVYAAFIGQRQQLLQQQADLDLNRLELTLTRQELAGQKNEMEKQNLAARKQYFETTFFNLLRLHQEITENITIEFLQGNNLRGRNCFWRFYNDIKGKFPNIEGNNDVEFIASIYGDHFIHFDTEIVRYFRNLANILLYIKQEDIPNKILYVSILKTQLSDGELLLMFYHGLSFYAEYGLKTLIEEFSLLEQVPIKKLISPTHVQYYNQNAFETDRNKLQGVSISS